MTDAVKMFADFGSLAGVLVVVYFFLRYLRLQQKDHQAGLLEFADKLHTIGRECHTKQKEIADDFRSSLRDLATSHREAIRDVASEIRLLREKSP